MNNGSSLILVTNTSNRNVKFVVVVSPNLKTSPLKVKMQFSKPHSHPCKMVLNCVCEGVNNHKSLKSFLKCVNFLLKHIVKNSTIYDSRDQLFYDDDSKSLTWKKIASGYIQEYMLRKFIIQNKSNESRNLIRN